MTCEELELSISTGAPLEADAAAHLAGCARCQAFEADTRQLLAAATLPEPSAVERAALVGLAGSTLAQWRGQQRRRGVLRQLVGYAVAAGLGALLASAVLLRVPPRVVSAPAVAAEVASAEATLPELLDEDLHLSEDEVFFDVNWPSNAEGENL